MGGGGADLTGTGLEEDEAVEVVEAVSALHTGINLVFNCTSDWRTGPDISKFLKLLLLSLFLFILSFSNFFLPTSTISLSGVIIYIERIW